MNLKFGIMNSPSAESLAGMSVLEEEIDHAQRVAPRQLVGLSQEDIHILEEK